MTFIKNTAPIIFIALLVFLNIAALKQDITVQENISKEDSCLFYQTIYASHFACSGFIPNCVPAQQDENMCLIVTWRVSPDIVVEG